MHKEVAGEKKTKLSTKSRSLNKSNNYLFVSICGKGEFVFRFIRFRFVYSFRIYMQREKMTCFTFSAMLISCTLLLYMVSMFELKYNLCSKFQPYFFSSSLVGATIRCMCAAIVK